MAHAQKPDFVFRRNGRLHLNRQGRQFSRLLAAEVCASALVMLDTPRSEVLWEYWLNTPFVSFLFTSPTVVTVCRRVSIALLRYMKIAGLYFEASCYVKCGVKILKPWRAASSKNVTHVTILLQPERLEIQFHLVCEGEWLRQITEKFNRYGRSGTWHVSRKRP